MIHRISAIQSILQVLTVEIQNTVDSLKAQISVSIGGVLTRRPDPCPRKRLNLLSLPDETLCIIANEVYRNQDPHWEDHDVRSLSQTSQKLREVTISFPHIWTTVLSFDSNLYIDACLSRSRKSPVDVKLVFPSNSRSSNSMIISATATF